MKKELDEKLCREFPRLYRDRYGDMTTTSMCWGFDVGDGWFDLIYKASQKIEAEIKSMKPTCEWCDQGCHAPFENGCTGPDGFVDSRPKASQVKEKFGTLRFYMNRSSKTIDDIITEAEEESAVTCETCGKPGRLTTGGWIKTLCPEHEKDYLAGPQKAINPAWPGI
jgi:hypothetical protein